MICDFLASFSRREEKRPAPSKGRGHASELRLHRDHAIKGSAPDAVPQPGKRETLP